MPAAAAESRWPYDEWFTNEPRHGQGTQSPNLRLCRGSFEEAGEAHAKNDHLCSGGYVRECRRAAAEMNDPTHKKQMEVMAKIWETLASRLSKGNDKA